MSRFSLLIQRASVADALAILHLQKAAFLSQAALYNNYALPPLHQTLASLQEKFCTNIVLKALVQEKIVGSVRFKHVGDLVEVERLVVAPDFQNRGIGSGLLRKIEELTPSAFGYRLFTGNKSRKNIHIYQQLGYKITNRETSSQNIAIVRMEKGQPSQVERQNGQGKPTGQG